MTREVWAVSPYRHCYRAEKGESWAQALHSKGRRKKLDTNELLRTYVYAKLHLEWSLVEIAERLKAEYPEDISMRVSYETIYQHLHCLPRGELKKELSEDFAGNRSALPEAD